MIDLKVNHDSCSEHIEKWTEWWNGLKQPVALLDLYTNYWPSLDAKSRNMVKKSQRHFLYRGFVYNNHLQDIHEIHNSKPIRSGGPITSAYADFPTPINLGVQCSRHGNYFFGGFSNKKLIAYCWLVKCGQLGIINRIMGHGDYLTYGVMNGLINGLVHSKLTYGLRYINYLHVHPTNGGLDRFKRSVGFKPISETITKNG